VISSRRRGVTNAVFASTVAVLLIVAASGFLLYAGRPTMTETTSETMTHTTTSTEMMNETMQEPAIALVPSHGQMISSGWLIVAPLGNGSYAVSVYARGLEAPAMGDYIVEAAQNSGQMAMVPIAGANVTLSEFTTDSHGTGQYFAGLHENPSSVYESVSLLFIPGMRMQNATVVATATLTMTTSTHT
jgi:hypothetical protein